VSLKDNSCHYGKNSQREDNCFVCFASIQSQWVSQSPVLIIGYGTSPHCFKNIRKFPTTQEQETKQESMGYTSYFIDYLRALDAKLILLKHEDFTCYGSVCCLSLKSQLLEECEDFPPPPPLTPLKLHQCSPTV
jgi:hypothetical protein